MTDSRRGVPAQRRRALRLWAPAPPGISLLVEADGCRLAKSGASEGWHELDVPDLGVVARYLFELPDDTKVPDPASRFRLEDVHEP